MPSPGYARYGTHGGPDVSDQRGGEAARGSRSARAWAAVWALALGLLLFSALALLAARVWDREAIHDAARRGDVGRVMVLLDEDPSRLEQRNRLELTPLHAAAWEG